MIQRKKAARVYHPVKYPFITIRENMIFQYKNCEALKYVSDIGIADIGRAEHELLLYATKEIQKLDKVHIIGNAANKAGVLSLVVDGYSNEYVGEYLNNYGIAVRAGHHCAQPILRSLGLEGTVRATLGIYNNYEDVDKLVKVLRSL